MQEDALQGPDAKVGHAHRPEGDVVVLDRALVRHEALAHHGAENRIHVRDVGAIPLQQAIEDGRQRVQPVDGHKTEIPLPGA